jgi:hypothetical protein
MALMTECKALTDEDFSFEFERPTDPDPELAKEFAERGASRTFVMAIGGEAAARYMPQEIEAFRKRQKRRACLYGFLTGFEGTGTLARLLRVKRPMPSDFDDWLSRDPKALASLQRGIRQASKGDLHDLPESFYIDRD